MATGDDVPAAWTQVAPVEGVGQLSDGLYAGLRLHRGPDSAQQGEVVDAEAPGIVPSLGQSTGVDVHSLLQ